MRGDRRLFLVLQRFLALAYLPSVCAGFAFLSAIFAFLARGNAALMGRLRQPAPRTSSLYTSSISGTLG